MNNQQEEYVKISLQRYEDLKTKESQSMLRIQEGDKRNEEVLHNWIKQNKEIMKLIGDFLKTPRDNGNTYQYEFNLYLKVKGYSIETKGDTFIISKEQ